MKKKRLSLLLIGSDKRSLRLASSFLLEIEGLSFHIDSFSNTEEAVASKAYPDCDLCLLFVEKENSSISSTISPLRKGGFHKPFIVLAHEYDYSLDMETLQAGGSDLLVREDLSPLRLERSLRYALKYFREGEETSPFDNSERPFRTLIEQSPLSIMIFSTEGKITFMNEACENLFRIKLGDIADYNILEDNTLIEKGAMTHIKKAFAGETTKVPALKYHPDESKLSSALPSDRWIHSFMYPVKDERGKLSEVIVMHEDVTVSKKSEEATFHHLQYLDAMERINSVSIRANSVDEMLKGVLDEMLSIFQCDRTWLLYPCDPEAESWRVPMESYRPEWPGANVEGLEIPMDDDTRDLLNLALEKPEPIVFDASTGRYIPTSEQFHTKSQIFISVFPRTGSAWLLGLHHCANDHLFSKEEIDIFSGIGHRVGDAITSFLTMQDLKESEERFRTLVENAPEAIVVYDVDKNRYIDANENALHLFKRSYEELMQINPFHASLPLQWNGKASAHVVKEKIGEALQGKTPVFEWFLLDSEGNEIPCEIRLAMLPSAGRRLIRGSITDISERKKAEESLRQLSLAVEQSPASIIITDVNGRIEYVNSKFTQVTGYSREETLGQNPNMLKSGEHAAEFYQDLWQTVSSGKEWHGELLNRKKSAQLFWERASISPIFDDNGVIRNYLAVKEDITEKVRIEKEATRAAHLASLGELAAGVAHEINNPVNSIINFSRVLADRNKDNSEGFEICNRMIREGKRIASIVKNLLSFAREGEGEGEAVIVSDIIADTLALYNLPLRKSHINVEVNIPGSLPSVIANKHQLQQVFLNIITNARYALNEKFRHNDKDKTLKIGAKKVTRKKGAFIRVTFYDNGTGIPDRIKDKVLNPFFSTKPVNKGTGLGLSISHGIIEGHNGKIDIDSLQGEYTKVIIELPLTSAKKSNEDQTK